MSDSKTDFIHSTSTNIVYSSFGDLRKIIPKVVKAGFPVLLRGGHGIGKSEFVAGLAPQLKEIMELDREPVLLDRRLSQCADAGDIIGIPITTGKHTEHLPMKWYAQACDEPCILFADELDRALMDVRQSFFELGDSRKLHGHRLHPKTMIFSACNGSEHNDGTYSVTNFDPAELNRWWVADIMPKFSDWEDWAQNKGIFSQIIEFCKANQEFWLWKGEHAPNRVYPTPRSWARFAKTITKEDLVPKDTSLFLHLAAGFVGKEASIKMWDFLQTYDSSVSAEDIIDRGNFKKVSQLNNIEVLELGKKIMGRRDVMDFSLSKKQLGNLATFLQMIPAENFAKIWNELCVLGGEKVIFTMKPLFAKDFFVKIYTGNFVLDKKSEDEVE